MKDYRSKVVKKKKTKSVGTALGEHVDTAGQ